MASSPNRPTSPHLQIYRLPLTGLISITHRMTGVMLAFGLVLLVWQLVAVSLGEQSYTAMQSWMDFWLLRLIVWGFVYALFFHLCHGVRHLIWDAGFSFEPDQLERMAVIELACSFVLTVMALIIL